ncbi:MAG: DNA translocase FtsK [Lachnospiraceae bacterium]|nr:DNA translocase FtsK [Lachnospiraceae bacterium]
MAQSTKSTGRRKSSASGSTRKSSSGSKRKSTRRTKSEILEAAKRKQEATILVTLGICILLFISNMNIGGPLLKALSNIQFGIFGLLAYVAPVYIFLLILFVLSNIGITTAKIKAALSVVMVLFLELFCELISVVSDPSGVTGPVESFSYSSANHIGGGFLGGMTACFLVPAIGILGSFIIDIIGIIVCFIFISEKSLFAFLKDSGTLVHDSHVRRSDEREALREIQEENRARRMAEKEEKKKKRMEMTAEGVTLDTIVGGSENANEPIMEVHELQYEESTVTEEPTFETVNQQEETFKFSDTINNDTPDFNETYGNNENLKYNEDVIPPEFDETGIEKIRIEDYSYMEYTGSDSNVNNNTFDSEDISDSYDDMPQTEIPQEEVSQTEITYGEVTEEDYAPKTSKSVNEETPVTSVKQKIKEEPEEVEVKKDVEDYANYKYPPVTLLKPPAGGKKTDAVKTLNETADKLQKTLINFGVDAKVTNYSKGPAVTRFEITPSMGTKVSKILNLQDDIKLNLAAADIRIEAPIPGKSAIGIEVPNKETESVSLRELIDSEEFSKIDSKIAFAAGRDIAGKIVFADIAKMPHVLIAGATGSGKSVCINTIIMSILYKAKPNEVKLIMIDPKVVELSVYNGIPHLLIPVVTEPKKAAGALNWAVAEMDRRYRMFSEYGVRDMKGFNEKVDSLPKDIPEETRPEKMPQIVVIVDELADLMMVAPGDVESAICRLAQLARAAGIHLVIATQRPSVNVITGLIKANMPSRVAFAVTSGVDSRTILDMNGAEKLLGKGDMLYFPQNLQKPLRVQGAFVSDKEVSDVVDFLTKNNGNASYDSNIETSVNNAQNMAVMGSLSTADDNDRDVLFNEVGRFLIENEKGSIGVIQRKFKVGFNRAARIMDQLADAGVVGPEEGTKPRKILMTMEEFEEISG